MPCHQCPAAKSSGITSQLSNVDSNEDEDMDKKKDDGNEGDESNKSDLEDD